MAKNKLTKFALLSSYDHVIEADVDEVIHNDHPLKGNWNTGFFKNEKPIVLELGCGKGEYTTGLAERYPGKNFLGVDIKGARMWKGATHALDNGLKNVGFLRTRIEHIASFFAPGEISEIWVTFPDPQEKRSRATKRLTSTVFLNNYKKFLGTNGIVHLKTDNSLLYHYTAALCKHNELDVKFSTDDLYNSDLNEEVLLSIKTHYETLFVSKGFTIKYIRFTLNGHEPLSEPLRQEYA